MKKRPLSVFCLAVALFVFQLHFSRYDTEALSFVQYFLCESTGPGGNLFCSGHGEDMRYSVGRRSPGG